MIRLTYSFGATPLDLNEIEGLIPANITTQMELNEWEQSNILEAELQLNKSRREPAEILDMLFIKEVHRRMFGKTWKWAGDFRQTNKNIGSDWTMISVGLKNLLDDIQYQIKYPSNKIDQIATRFHHRLVFLHPFANGNGRHARLVTDLLLMSLGQSRFSWGSKNLSGSSIVRREYIDALRAADSQNYQPLLDFVRK